MLMLLELLLDVEVIPVFPSLQRNLRIPPIDGISPFFTLLVTLFTLMLRQPGVNMEIRVAAVPATNRMVNTICRALVHIAELFDDAQKESRK